MAEVNQETVNQVINALQSHPELLAKAVNGELPPGFYGPNVYIGLRYVPIFAGEWASTEKYEPLTIVTYMGDSYTSRTFVAAGIPVTNTDYWAPTGNYNAQIEQYRQETAAVSVGLQAIQQQVGKMQNAGVIGDITWYASSNSDSTWGGALAAALENHDVIYFPSGSYTFDNFEIPHDCVLYGDGVINAVMQPESSMSKTAFAANGKSVVIKGLAFKATSAGTDTTLYPMQACLSFKNCPLVYLEGIDESGFTGTYRMSTATTPNPNDGENGLFLQAWDCANVVIKDSHIGQFDNFENTGIWVFDKPLTETSFYLIGCRITCSPSTIRVTGGSSITALAGTIYAVNNRVEDYDNRYGENLSKCSSVFNLFCKKGVAYGNHATANSASIFDFSEAYLNKNDSIVFTDNYVHSLNNNDCMHCCPRVLTATGNYLKGASGIYTYTFDTTRVQPASDPDPLYYDYDSWNIEDNTFISTGTPSTLSSSGLLTIGYQNGTASNIKRLNISGNTFSAEKSAGLNQWPPIVLITPPLHATISNNTFWFMGITTAGENTGVAIYLRNSAADSLWPSASLKVIGNVFEADGTSPNFAVQGVSATRSLILYIIHNIGQLVDGASVMQNLGTAQYPNMQQLDNPLFPT